MIRILGQTASLDTITPQQTGQIKGLLDYRTTKFENDANRPSCFQQLQAVIYPKSRYFTIRLPVYL